ncbi:MAG: CBS domain-containing protein [Marmoricola sp.]
MLVREVMTRQPVTVAAEASVGDALALLDKHAITSLPVVSSDAVLVGVLSEADLLVGRVLRDARSSLILHEEDDSLEARGTVGAVMTARPMTVTEDTDVAAVAKMMTTTGFKSLPVVDARNRVVGVVSRRDIVRMLARPATEVEQELTALFRSLDKDWTASVQDGNVTITGPTEARDRSLAMSAASTVPGVVKVHIA